MPKIDPIYVGPEAAAQLVRYCEAQRLNRFVLVVDTNTYAAQGERVESALKAKGYELTRIVLEGKEVIADERYLVQVLVRTQPGHSTFLAVGSGTLTDITRFTSHRMGQAFISIPTAPSVDGFASTGAPLVLNGVKYTIPCQSPIALFADLDTLASAPQKLIAAGFGDMLGKLTSLADWKLGSLLWDEPFSAEIFKRTLAAASACIDHAAEIGQRSRKGVEILMNALIESGVCMLDFGDSRPASGSEHHASHYWEMKLLQENRPAIFHGAKVGVATLHIIGQYAAIRNLSRQEMQDRLEAASLPTREQEYAVIRQGYPGDLAEGVIREHTAFLNLTEEGFDKVKRRILDQWEAIQAVAAKVPPPEQVAGYLRLAGAATDGVALGLNADETRLGFQYGHYLRNRFTVMKLCRVLGLPLA